MTNQDGTATKEAAHCVVEGCEEQIDPGVSFYCDEKGGPFCGKHFEELHCEERHGEGCLTQCIR